VTPEKKVKQKVVAILKKFGAYYFYPVMAGYGSSGIPDIIVCFKGRFIAIECKAGKNQPTVLQQRNIDVIKKNEGIAIVVNESTIKSVQNILNEIGESNAEIQNSNQ
jgi:Holliday junction resolvase